MKTYKKAVLNYTNTKLTSGNNFAANVSIYTTETADGQELHLFRYGSCDEINDNPPIFEEEVFTDIWSFEELLKEAIKEEGNTIYICEYIAEDLMLTDPDAEFWQDLYAELQINWNEYEAQAPGARADQLKNA